MIDSMEQDFSDKKILLKESDPLFAKAMSAKIFKDLGCEVHTVTSMEELKASLSKDEKYFLGVFYCSSESDMGAIEQAIQKNLPIVALTDDFDAKARESLIALGVVDYALKRSVDDIDYLVRIVRQLAVNSQIKAVVADDSALYRKSIGDILRNQLFTVFEARDGVEAASIIDREGDIKLLLTDYFMPNMDGFELVTHVRKTKSKDQLSIVAILSDSSEIVASKFLKYGADGYIKKPFSKEEFVSSVGSRIEYITLIEFQKELANFDFLSGLYNRKYMSDAGRTMHANAVRGNIDFIIGMLDIDGFKSINDRYGHDAGDLVIKDCAKRLKESFRSSDIVCRFGGGEFCVLLTNVDDDHIATTLNKFLHSIRSSEVVTRNNNRICYTVSIGVCATLYRDFEYMIKIAEEKMYEAKKAGRDRFFTDIIPS